MKLLNWINHNRRGNVSEFDDRFEIAHDSGEHSVLFKKAVNNTDEVCFLKSIGDIYTTFDRIDLFSSTFKISSLNEPKFIEGVEVVEGLAQFNTWAEGQKPLFPEKSIPFMYQAGIGVYAIGKESGKIYEWDDEQGKLTDEFDNLEDVFQEWLNAVI
ncbi:hypothetical protein [Marinomonas sp. 2405UD68-3]|uniref:hypothetical protein n=1 Tax=Marinomonas sp. 2405UD68-3 TaxID=3391835 RepID=UPI0039C900B0